MESLNYIDDLTNSRNTAATPSSSACGSLDFERALLKMKNAELIDMIRSLKRENTDMQATINSYERDIYEYASKSNHLQNILQSANSVAKRASKNLIDFTDGISGLVQLLNAAAVSSSLTNNSSDIINIGNFNTLSNKEFTLPSKQESTHTTKAHVVKPHMVNGHILYIPTINLTRVNHKIIGDNKAISVDENHNDDEHQNVTASTSTNSNNGIINTEVVEELPPRPQSQHSAILSGTFQEVKIYLNQIPTSTNKTNPNNIISSSSGAGSSAVPTIKKKIKTRCNNKSLIKDVMVGTNIRKNNDAKQLNKRRQSKRLETKMKCLKRKMDLKKHRLNKQTKSESSKFNETTRLK